MKHETAESMYEERKAKINELLTALKKEVNRKPTEKITYADSGSLGHVQELLEQAVEFYCE